MLDEVREAFESLGKRVEDIEGTDAQGNVIQALRIHHGTNEIIAVAENERCVKLVHITDIHPEDGALLARQPPDVQMQLISLLKRELLEGRSGYAVNLDQTADPPELRRITIEQLVVVTEYNNETLQRLADAIQELVVVGIRGRLILGAAFTSLASADRPYDGYAYG